MTIAFIPARGGSKSIPLKNIKSFCGKPLIYWTLAALQNCSYVDKIVVATDSPEIKKIVLTFNFSKVELYNRKAENACDISTSESVMLEYIDFAKLEDSITFMLVQATSPLTETKHFDGGISLYNTGKYDSILTCVRNYRFFWNEDGTSNNYDYKKRPRRQDFDGMLMENGAFYINSVKNIKDYENRLCGRIGIYEMPVYTANEIDEPDDWIILEELMHRHVLSNKKKDYSRIKLFISDVDGVLTDGGMFYSEKGDELKKFNTHDGMAFQLLREHGIRTAIITTENTKIIEQRANKLQIDYLMQGKRDGGKLEAAESICKDLGITLAEVTFVGDDLNDIALLQKVGFAFCPLDAQPQVLAVSGISVIDRVGGSGVIRKIVNEILFEG